MWWINNLKQHNGHSHQISQWDSVIESDASMRGWGASCGRTSTGGLWTKEESHSHIDYLELLAGFLALKTFTPQFKSSKVLLRLNNITEISFINRMERTHSSQLSNLAAELWKWCLQRDLVKHADHLPGRENVRGISPHERMDAPKGDLLTTGTKLWTLHDRPLCFQNERTDESILLQLEAGSSSTGSWCSVNIIGEPQTLLVLPICPDKTGVLRRSVRRRWMPCWLLQSGRVRSGFQESWNLMSSGQANSEMWDIIINVDNNAHPLVIKTSHLAHIR